MKSIVTEYQYNCAFCGKPTNEKHHLIFGTAGRALADKDGLTIPCCDNCHRMNRTTERIHGNPMAEKMSKMMGQLAFEAYIGTREEFRKRYGVSYL